jgi:hypothetical protein
VVCLLTTALPYLRTDHCGTAIGRLTHQKEKCGYVTSDCILCGTPASVDILQLIAIHCVCSIYWLHTYIHTYICVKGSWFVALKRVPGILIGC